MCVGETRIPWDTRMRYRIAGYFRNRNFRRSDQICISKVFIFEECIFRRFQINGNPCQNL